MKEVKKKIIDQLEAGIRYAYSWLPDGTDELIGNLVYILHIFSLSTIFILIFMAHVVYPVIWFQVFVFLIGFIIWLQHVLLHTCVCTSLEKKLLGQDSKVTVDIVLNMFEIPISRESRAGVTVLLSTVAVAFMGLNITSRLILYLREYFGFSTWV